MTGEWRQYDGERLDPVLAAAVEAFLEVGYHGSTVRDIAARCGLSVAGIYHHYSGKQDLLVTILDRTMTDLAWRTAAARDEGTTPVERFTLLVEALVCYHAHRRKLASIGASEMRSLTPPNRRRIAAMRTAQQRLVDAEVERAVADGAFTTPYPKEAARGVVTMCVSVAQWFRPRGDLRPEALAERYVALALATMGYVGPADP